MLKKADAQSIIDTLNNTDGDKLKAFKKLAKSKSTDTSNKSDGGVVSAFDNTDTSLDSAYKKAAFKLKTNEYTTSPVKTDSGYQVIYMVKNPGKGTEKQHTADLKDQIITEDMSNSTKLHSVVTKVLKKGNVSIKDSDLKNILDDYLATSSSTTTSSN